jgi:hypothetical protein
LGSRLEYTARFFVGLKERLEGELGDILSLDDPERWRWHGKLARSGNDKFRFLSFFAAQVNSGSGAVVFAIGRALNGHVNDQARTIFNNEWSFDQLIGPANQAIAFYKSQLDACRKAIFAWSLVGIRLGVVKDIRIVIGKLVWDTRDQGKFKDS